MMGAKPLKGYFQLPRLLGTAKAAPKLAGETRIVTSLSCGVRLGTAPAEQPAADPSLLLRVIDSVVAPLMDDASDAGAMVSPFQGESFMAHWNVVQNDSEHAMHACEAASRMIATLATVNEELIREHLLGAPPGGSVQIYIGISMGSAIVGGLALREGTGTVVAGGNAALADRVRALGPRYGYSIVVSEATRQAAGGNFAFLELDRLAFGEKDVPLRLYAMLGNPLSHANPKFRALAAFHDRIFDALRAQKWDEARRLVEQCRKLSGASQKLYDLHLARIAWFETRPPGPDWDGTFRPPIV
jgi:adenylate cyclase